MIKDILSIAGKPGLYKLVSQGKNMLIVQALTTGKRLPVYAHEKVVSLGDISMYTTEEDIPLAQVFENVRADKGGEKVDIKALGGDSGIREYFKVVLPNFDEDRVYTSDIKKMLQWYNMLIDNGITEFVEPAEEAGQAEGEKAE